MERYQIHHAPYNKPSCLEASHHVESTEKPYDSSEDAKIVYDFIKKLPNGIVQGLLSLLKNGFEKTRKHKIPQSEIGENEDSFLIKEKGGSLSYVTIPKTGGCVTMKHPIKGAVTPESMKGVYVSEREGSLELFIHFISKGEVDRLWCVGKLEQDLRKEAIEWTKKVNSLYRK